MSTQDQRIAFHRERLLSMRQAVIDATADEAKDPLPLSDRLCRLGLHIPYENGERTRISAGY